MEVTREENCAKGSTWYFHYFGDLLFLFLCRPTLISAYVDPNGTMTVLIAVFNITENDLG